MDKSTKLDGGTLEQRTNEMKDFFGLKPEQSFQDIEVEEEDEPINE